MALCVDAVIQDRNYATCLAALQPPRPTQLLTPRQHWCPHAHAIAVLPAVVVRPDFPNVRELQRAFIQLAADADVREAHFNETNNPEGYVFQSSVDSFIPIESSTPAYLGPAGRASQAVAALRATPITPAT